ncbi:hypothetical protein KKB18_08505, partial [bacterium]|nr:hypothetical protein [bacterium]
ISWPDEIFIGGFCDSSNVSEDCKWDIETAVTLMHEVGHVLYYKMLAECGGSFSDLYITPVALEEAVTFLAELFMFQGDFLKSISMVNSEIEPYYNDWRKMRIRFLRELLGFSRFDLEAYKLALESPDNMNDVWLSKLSEQTGVDYSDSHWAVVSYGFYTEDPMRRYAYILSALLAKKIAGDTWQGVINPSSYSPSGFLNIIQNLVTNWVDCPQVVLNDLSF